MGARKGFKGRWLAGGVAIAAVWAVPAAAPGALAAGASTFTVSSFGDPATSSCTAPDASGNSVCPTLRSAVEQASTQNDDPTIDLQPGIYELNNPSGQLDLASAMNIVGAGPGGPGGTTIEQTDGHNRVLEVDGTSTLSGLEITGGRYSPSWVSGRVVYGGGILALGALTLQNMLVTENAAIGANGTSATEKGDQAEGGGIYYGTSAITSTISNSTISGNSAVGGGGGVSGSLGGSALGGGIAYSGSGGRLTVQASMISANTATAGPGGGNSGGLGGTGGSGQGGGLFNSTGVTLSATTIASNAATGGQQGASGSPGGTGGVGEGGGIFNSGGSDQIVNSTVFGNSAQGGTASAGGTADGFGGGIGVSGLSAGLTLQSDTVDANSASVADGNLHIPAGAPPATIQDTIMAAGSPDNCGIATPASSESNNLEDDAAGQCGFSAANHDLIGANPQLPSALAQNGGPTATLAPAPGSPVLGSGGSCLDPTSSPPNQPLTTDQRGDPRSTTCDIGSFQGQRPHNVLAPTVSGRAQRGQTLICSQGTWTGDGLLAYAFTWLRNGAAIPGTTTNTYVVGAADAGQTLACQVTVTYYGSSTTSSPFLIVPSNPIITVLRVTSSPPAITVALGCRGPDGRRCVGALVATVMQKRRGGKVIGLSAPTARSRGVTLGQHRYSILARHVATIRIPLKRRVKLLLGHFRTVPVLLTVTQTIDAGSATIASLHLKIRRAEAGRGG